MKSPKMELRQILLISEEANLNIYQSVQLVEQKPSISRKIETYTNQMYNWYSTSIIKGKVHLK